MSAARKLMNEESTGSSSAFFPFGLGSATTSMRPFCDDSFLETVPIVLAGEDALLRD